MSVWTERGDSRSYTRGEERRQLCVKMRYHHRPLSFNGDHEGVPIAVRVDLFRISKRSPWHIVEIDWSELDAVFPPTCRRQSGRGGIPNKLIASAIIKTLLENGIDPLQVKRWNTLFHVKSIFDLTEEVRNELLTTS